MYTASELAASLHGRKLHWGCAGLPAAPAGPPWAAPAPSPAGGVISADGPCEHEHLCGSTSKQGEMTQEQTCHSSGMCGHTSCAAPFVCPAGQPAPYAPPSGSLRTHLVAHGDPEVAQIVLAPKNLQVPACRRGAGRHGSSQGANCSGDETYVALQPALMAPLMQGALGIWSHGRPRLPSVAQCTAELGYRAQQ